MPLDWICESVRLSLFSTEAIRLSADNWKLLTGQDEPDREQKGGGRHVFTGQVFGGQFSLGAVGNRCDCILGPVRMAGEIREEPVPNIGQWPSVLSDFQRSTETFLEQVHFPVSRMAFATGLLHPTDSIKSAYKALREHIKTFNQPAEELRDVLFRINWPRNSTTLNDLTLNRLTTWQVQQISVQVLIPDGNSPATSFVAEPVHVLRLDVDHNTDGKRTQPFDANQLVPIYRELTNLALQNAEIGEVY
jgi:hypothetical protein